VTKQVRSWGLIAQGNQSLGTAEAWHTHVQNCQADGLGVAASFQCLDPVASGQDGEAVQRQSDAQQRANIVVVLDHQNQSRAWG
jgi:hypothetical protein